jgi:hypothetical protein
MSYLAEIAKKQGREMEEWEAIADLEIDDAAYRTSKRKRGGDVDDAATAFCKCLAEIRADVSTDAATKAKFAAMALAKFKAEVGGADDDDEMPDDLISRVVAAHGNKISRAEALEWIRGTMVGREVHRNYITSKQAGDNMTTKAEVIAEFKKKRIAKLATMPIIEVAKMALAVPDQNILQIDEAEFVDLVTAAAKREYPSLRADAAFTKMFGEGDRGTLIRKAHKVVKEAASLAPMVSGGVDQQRAAINDTESSEAYKQLTELAEKQRATAPYLSSAQAFARAFEQNPELAKRAHQRPDPTSYQLFPR